MVSRLIVPLLLSVPLAAQTCDTPIPPITPPGPTIFTPEQEGFLGDFFEDQARRGTAVYRQPGLTDPMDKIAARLLQYLPANSYKFQFTLVELSSANAYAIPGGRIFVSRLLIASLESEDELAGILAHEMGHILARQGSVDFSRALRDALKITALSDRADVYAQLNALLDAPAAKGRKDREQDDQLEADRVSSAASWRAGYDPAAYAKALDRVTGNKGATGGFLSDLFRATRPESKRYRELLKSTEIIPAACRQARTADDGQFRAWQKRVADLAPEDLLTTQSTRPPAGRLTPPLRPDLSNIKFSPDGKFLLAQDQSGIFVLRPEPLAVLFRIPALAAEPALFHSDSLHLMFQTGTGRIEMWNLDTRARERRWDLPLGVACEAILAPNAKSFACSSGIGRAVTLYDLDSGAKLAQHQFLSYNPLLLLAGILLGQSMSHGMFSPDGSVFLFSSKEPSDEPWAYSPAQRKEVSIGRPLKGALNGSFAFMDGSRVASVASNEKDSGLFSFPEGKQISKFAIPATSIYAATKGDTLLLRPLGNYAAALLSIEEREIFQASTKAAIDRYLDLGASERNNGELALYRGKSSQPVAVLQLPEGGMTSLRSAAHSPDLSWLALSASTRGQVWYLRGAGSSLTPAFDGGSITTGGQWTATFEQREPKPGSQATTTERYRTTFDLPKAAQVSSVKIVPDEGARVWFTGKFEVRLGRATAKTKARIDVRESVTGRLQWTRYFEETPQLYLGNALVVRMDLDGKDAREIAKRLKDRGDVRTPESELIDVLNMETGVSAGQMLIEVGGTIRSANLVGGVLFLEDSNNRTLGYDLATGERTGQQFGRILASDPAHGRVAASNQIGSIAVLDARLRPIANFDYPRNVIYAGFDGTGTRLLVVTGAQEVFIEVLPE
jgi:WD40 repeat protein